MKLEDSDIVLPMATPDSIFNNLIDSVRNSCLNYHAQISPFSAVISVKKSFVKDYNGCSITPKTVSSTPVTEETAEEALKKLSIQHAELLNVIKLIREENSNKVYGKIVKIELFISHQESESNCGNANRHEEMKDLPMLNKVKFNRER